LAPYQTISPSSDWETEAATSSPFCRSQTKR